MTSLRVQIIEQFGHISFFFRVNLFIMYIADVNKPAGGANSPPSPLLQPDYPSPPSSAVSFTNNASQIPIDDNQTMFLQCVVSNIPRLIVVGGGLQEGAEGIAKHYCSPGEVCGDPVS